MTTGDPPSIDPAEIYQQLKQVTDPELDRPLTDLGFIDDVLIEGADVTVALRLPTGMCSPVFAWMMARDAHDNVRTLSNVDQVTVTLSDHLFAEQITTGINEGRTFNDVFEDAETGPEYVRRKLDWKACLARGYKVIDVLRQKGLSSQEIVQIERDDVRIEDGIEVISLGNREIEIHQDVLSNYLQKATQFEVATEPSDCLLVNPNGDPIELNSFDRVRRRLRAAYVNKENQGHRCEQLLESRYEMTQEHRSIAHLDDS